MSYLSLSPPTRLPLAHEQPLLRPTAAVTTPTYGRFRFYTPYRECTGEKSHNAGRLVVEVVDVATRTANVKPKRQPPLQAMRFPPRWRYSENGTSGCSRALSDPGGIRLPVRSISNPASNIAAPQARNAKSQYGQYSRDTVSLTW